VELLRREPQELETILRALRPSGGAILAEQPHLEDVELAIPAK
jgi:hypothetical protein